MDLSLSQNLQKFIGYFFKNLFILKECYILCLYHTERSLPLDALVIRYYHQNTGYKIYTEDEISNGRIDKMIGPQGQLNGSLVIMELTKNYRLFFWKFAHFETSVLERVFAHHTERSRPLDTLVISYHHRNTGHKIQTKDKISNGRIDGMIGPQEQLSGSLIIIKLTRICFFFGNLFTSKKVSLKEFLATTNGTQNTAQTVKWPCELIILSMGHLESPIEV